MALETTSPRYSPVNTRNNAASGKDTVDDAGYLNGVKRFLSTTPLPKLSKTKSSRSSYSCTILLIIGFILSLFLTVFLWFTDIYTTGLYKRLTIQNGSLLYDSWRDPPVKPLMCIYLFNYTNVNEFMNGMHHKLKVQEVGPYCYRETLHRVNIVDHKNGSQTFNEMKSQEFDYASSNGTDLDLITLPDIPIISAIAMTKDANFFIRKTLASVLNQVSNYPFVTVSVYDFCFGYRDDVIKTLGTLAQVANKPVPFEKFGLFSKRVGVSLDRLTVNSGENDLNEMGQVTHLNGKSILHPWKSEVCNAVSGSDGMFFPRNAIQHGEPVNYFHKDSCRKLQLTFHSEKQMPNGVVGHLYSLARNAFNNSVPENNCYCTRYPCMPDGVFDIGPCSDGSPISISRVHFLYSDPSLLDAVEGLSPDPEKHELYWLMDPLIGITMETNMRIQLNIQVRNPHEYGALSTISDNTILPFAWLDIRTRTSPKLGLLLFSLTYTIQWVQMFLMCLSLVGLLVTSFFLIRMMTRRLKKNIVIISSEIQPMNRLSEKIPI